MSNSRPQDKVLQAYIKKFGSLPNEPNQLVSFSRGDPNIPTIIYSDAKKALLKIAKSIKGGPKKKSFKKLIGAGPKWQVGDEVLISKDRTGILHYIGKVPEMGNDDKWYGIELTCGTMGHNDGSVKGTQYFTCQGKRGMFIPEKKLRRRLNRKDKERRNSYAEISGHVKQLQKEYADEATGAILYPSSQQAAKDQMTTLVFENPQHAERYGNGGQQYQSAALRHEYKDKTSSDDEATPPPVKKKKKKKKKSNKKKITRQRSGSGQSSASRERRSSHHSKHDTSDDAEAEESELSDVSELEDDNDPNPTVKTFDTLLKYILRQKGQYRQGLLDVYANPQTHALIVEAFSEMKELKPAEQTYLWPALLKRWSKYVHKT